MEQAAKEKIQRILEAHNRINEIQNQVDLRINQMIGGGSTDPEPPIEVHDPELHAALDQIEAACIRMEQRLNQSLAKLHQINR